MLTAFTFLCSNAVSTTVGVMYPAYASFKALKNRADVDLWLTYWVVFALWTVSEMFLDLVCHSVLGYHYYGCKIAFILYLTLPQFRGFEVLYSKYLEPALTSNEQRIDQGLKVAMELAEARATQMVGLVRSTSQDFVSNKLSISSSGKNLDSSAADMVFISKASTDETNPSESLAQETSEPSKKDD